MIFKKSTVALCSSSNLAAFLSSPNACYSTSSCNPNKKGPQCRESIRISSQQRCYATVSDDSKKSTDSSKEHAWPSSQHPTPYEIFNQRRSAPYSKAKFYELVKIYHPDRHHHTPGHLLSHTARLERYRLIVAANEILSDPTKRRAYDLYGAGWGATRSMENLYRTADRSWRDVPGNPSMNATWEDWERWYDERDGTKKENQRPVFMSNQLFASVLCVFVVIGSFGQARRATSTTTNLVEMRDEHSMAISEGMRKRQNEKAFLNRHERVENFLRQRDGWAFASSPNHHAEANANEK
ncbi:uncharacterized protein F4822DRAFT_414611 [Hypoxylon trugodes]|uniref:uncharacterized protein n=1 Tax=Hypoxylon trugodes TaxID=326681 RepID=UPI00218CD742|nr:uncharacterized protein F4822DRAFT_414611 [Hypoxylon trugodes]KAI1385969.1 hypothetical protein F4822DRAFT_414611 [Hypoxylon trugodes]